MENQLSLDKLETAPEDKLKGFEGMLSEQAVFLAPLSETLVARWSELYLNTFGRSSFFSEQRVQKVFKELADLFIACLKERCLEIYFETLKEKGGLFYRLGVPFEEVMVSLHLFEEVCLEQFLESYANRSKLPRLILAMEELHSEGLATLASSYFEAAKKEMQKITESLKEENESLRDELTQTKSAYFAHTTKELTNMQLMVSSINHKLRHRVYQLSRIQKMSDALEGESHIPNLLKIATQQLMALCPENSDVYFGFFDDDRRMVSLYGHEAKRGPHCDIVKTFYFSELSRVFQDVLYDETKKFSHLKGHEHIPKTLLELVTIKNQREFFFVPIRKFKEVEGFLLLCTQTDDFFTKSNYSFFQRIGQGVSKALTSALLFTKSKRQTEFASVLDELNRKKAERKSIETTLDFCLGSLIDLLGAERSSLMRFDKDKNELKVCAAKGYKVYPISGVPIKWGEGVAGLSLKESKIIAITKMKEAARSNFLSRALKTNGSQELKVKSLLCLPLLELDRPLGVVNISTINFHKNFDKSEIDMAHHLVKQMAGIVKHL